MVYIFFKHVLQLGFRFYFKHIHFGNSHRVPKNQPVIFAANHPSAFMDPILVAVNLPGFVHYLVRGDMFKKPIARWFFGLVRMIPVYRIDEGFENLHRNNATQDRVAQLLKAREKVMIFAEGYSHTDRSVLKLKKGMARMALNDELPELVIIPVGISYSKTGTFRQSVYVDFGEPIPVKEFQKTYQDAPAKTVASLNEKAYNGLHKSVLTISHPQCAPLLELHFEMYRNSSGLKRFPVIVRNDKELMALQNLSDKFCEMKGQSESTYEKLEKQTYQYFESLKNIQVDEKFLSGTYKTGWVDYFIAAVGFPFFLAGIIISYPPARISKYLADKMVKRLDFYDSVMGVLGGVICLFYLLFITLFCIVYSGNFSFLALLVLIPITSFFSLVYLEKARDYLNHNIFKKHLSSNPEAIQSLIHLRKELLAYH